MKFISLLLVLSIALTASGVAESSDTSSHKACNFFPPNKLKFSIGGAGQMTEMTFKRVIQVVEQVYAPLFRDAGKPPLIVSAKWEDDEVNAFALDCSHPELLGKPGYPKECGKMKTSEDVITPFSLVAMSGGLARHPLMTADAFMIVICHEIGHHLGGFPRYAKNTNWASTEGQSDYFSTAKCARRVFKAIGKNEEWVQKFKVDFEVRKTCQSSFPTSEEDAAICMRASMAGLTLANVFASFEKKTNRDIDFKTPDTNKVSVTRVGHSGAQCRLDTYYAGSLCQIPAEENFGPDDSRTGACHTARIENNGVRPTCWFHD